MTGLEEYEHSIKELKKFVDRSIEIYHEIKGHNEAEHSEFPEQRKKSLGSRLRLERDMVAQELLVKHSTLKNIKL